MSGLVADPDNQYPLYLVHKCIVVPHGNVYLPVNDRLHCVVLIIQLLSVLHTSIPLYCYN